MTGGQAKLMRRDLLLPALLVFLAVWTGAALMQPGFWVLDESVRYMQGTSLLSSLRLPPPLLIPGGEGAEGLDPRLAPVPFHYGRVENGLVYAQYSPALALTSVPFRALLGGHAGTFVVPALGSALCWLLLASSFMHNGFGRMQAFLLPIAGAPLIFYGMTFWSHTLASGLVLAAVVTTIAGRRFALPVLLISAAALFREEALPFLAFPLLLGEGTPRRKLSILTVTGLAFLAASRLLTGSWLGTHLSASGAEQDLYGHSGMGWIEARLFVIKRALLTTMPGIPIPAGAAGGILLAGLWAVAAFGLGRAASTAAAAGLALVAASLAAAAFRGFRLLDTLYCLKSPLIIFPALWLVRPRGRSALILSGILLLMLLIMAPMHAEDLAWGSRLIMMPLLALLLSAVPVSPRRTWAVVGVGILSCGVSVGFLARKRALSDELAMLAAGEGGAVIVTDWLLTGEFAGEMEKGLPVAFTPLAADFAEAADLLRDLRPVAVSRVEDLGAQMQLFRDLGFQPLIAGVVEFDPALRVAVVNLSGTGAP
jgi:hypothetical protein